MQNGRVWNRRAFKAAKESGDLTFAAFSCSNMIVNLLASKAHLLLKGSQSFFEAAEYPFYSALAHAAFYTSASTIEQPRHLEALATHYKQLAIWNKNCPENFGSCAALIAAEIARIEGRELDAEQLYEKAIQSAREHGFVQNEAIAHEIAVRFYSERGLETIAQTYLQNARHLHVRWGALGKVKHVEVRYPSLREQPHSQADGTLGSS